MMSHSVTSCLSRKAGDPGSSPHMDGLIVAEEISLKHPYKCFLSSDFKSDENSLRANFKFVLLKFIELSK